MVSHQHRGFGRHVVHTVLQLMGRGLTGVVHALLFSQPTAICDIPNQQNGAADQ